MSSINDSLSFSDGQSVALIVGIATVVALLSICCLIGVMVCRWVLYRRSHRGWRRQRSTSVSLSGSGSHAKISGEKELFAYATNSNFYEQPLHNVPRDTETSYTDSETPQRHSSMQSSLTDVGMRMQKRRTRLEAPEFPRSELTLVDYLGEGQYGPIYKGEAQGLGVKNQPIHVTVKSLQVQTTDESRIKFEQENAVLSTLNHPNVIKLLAKCTKEPPKSILFDAGEDLHSYVRRKRGTILDDQTLRESSPVQVLSQQSMELLPIADEVCLGMAYLVSQQYVHKDLALRNCIRGHDGVVKVGNFGLGPSNYPQCYYIVENEPMPIRWMSPEAISTGQFTTANDQWAFGVLMWELFTYGTMPYAEKSNEEVIRFVAQDFGRLSQPEECLQDIYQVMSSCWEFAAGSRPAFLTLHERLFKVTSELEKIV